MTREDIQKEILSLEGSNWLLELATGTGKSKMALEKIRYENRNSLPADILVVVPRNVHKQNWKDEFKKWWPDCKNVIVYTTYVSFPKHRGHWDYVIFDECHHLSERCRTALKHFDIDHSLLLSATVNRDLKKEFIRIFKGLKMYKRDLRDVIEDAILPDPKVYLLPLDLRTDAYTEFIMKNPNLKTRPIECKWEERWNHIRQKRQPVKIHCTEMQYLIDLNKQIEFWKKKYMGTRTAVARNKWLRLCGDRLKWLSDKKIGLLHNLLSYLKDCRTLTFCNSIEQTERLGEYCINSKNADSTVHLEDFNKGKIHHITACNMLNEGMNLMNCQVGIYANLNSSETIVKQRMGRLLRHPNPIIIVPYYKKTREEELVERMLEDYNPELVTKINDIYEIMT